MGRSHSNLCQPPLGASYNFYIGLMMMLCSYKSSYLRENVETKFGRFDKKFGRVAQPSSNANSPHTEYWHRCQPMDIDEVGTHFHTYTGGTPAQHGLLGFAILIALRATLRSRHGVICFVTASADAFLIILLGDKYCSVLSLFFLEERGLLCTQ